ncbi:MAG: FAD-dependent oxidoreductase [Candidatus Nanopelagicales bacterium]
MPFARHPRPQTLAALADLTHVPFWLDNPSRPDARAALVGPTDADLLVVGAGFTGLWTALLAKEADPGLDVVLVEGGRVADGATGRNGGFVASSLTHGFHNGVDRWPGDMRTLVAMGHANLDALEETVTRLGIDCDFRRSGEIDVATEPYQVEHLRGVPDEAAPYGEKLEWLDRDQVRALVDSPTYLGAVYDREGVAMVDPARLAWGLRDACLALGVRLYERTPVTGLSDEGAAVRATTPYGSVRAARVALATNAFPPLLRRLSHYVVPVWDYVLVTEPLTAEQRDSIGWSGRQGVGDSGNQFHYYRTTEDGRILWGGYDAIYHWNNGFDPRMETDPESFGRLAEHFVETFPQLEGVRFTHGWGGAIDTCSRFSAFWGRAHRGKTAYVIGYTGLGVGASRFGAQVVLDLLAGRATQRTALEMVRDKPLPFPPEPVRSIGIGITRRSLDKADRREGHRDLWLRTLDRLGLGFDS